MAQTNSIISAVTPEPETFWQFWTEFQPQSWQDAISTAAILMAGDATKILSNDEEATVFDIAQECLELGAVLGYSLRATEGASVVELADWPARALAMADLPTWESLQRQLRKGGE